MHYHLYKSPVILSDQVTRGFFLTCVYMKAYQIGRVMHTLGLYMLDAGVYTLCHKRRAELMMAHCLRHWPDRNAVNKFMSFYWKAVIGYQVKMTMSSDKKITISQVAIKTSS